MVNPYGTPRLPPWASKKRQGFYHEMIVVAGVLDQLGAPSSTVAQSRAISLPIRLGQLRQSLSAMPVWRVIGRADPPIRASRIRCTGCIIKGSVPGLIGSE